MNSSLLYVRVSSKVQEETGYSLPAQEKLLKEYASKKEFSINKVFSVSESASGKQQRETFSQMISYANKNNIKIILCEKADRLTRNFADMVLIDDWLLEDAERQVHLVKDSLILHRDSRSQEKLNWGIRVLFAKNYIDNLSEEIKKGHNEKLRQGWIPNKPPIGYKTIGEQGHKTHIIDNDKAHFVKEMFELYASGNYSIKKLVEIMFENGLRTRGGYKLVKSRLHDIISDPFYYGMIRWRGEIYQGKQEPLISKGLFDMVQNVLNKKNTPKYRKHFPTFKALLKCSECGGTITWEIQKGHWYGHCNHYKQCSQKGFIRQEKIEEQLISRFDNITIKDKNIADWVYEALKESHKDKIIYSENCLNDLNAQFKRVQNRLDALYNDKLDGLIDSTTYERKYKEFTQEKENLLDSIKRHNEAGNKYLELGLDIFRLSQNAKSIYSKGTNEEKRRLLSIVFSNMSLDASKNVINTNYNIPFQLLSEKTKQLNSSKLQILSGINPKNFEPSNCRRKDLLNTPENEVLLRR